MKKFLIDAGYMFDPETMSLSKIHTQREAISRIYLVNEPCEVQYNDTVKTADAGDLIIVFYEKAFENNFVIVKSDEWKKNLDVYNETQQKQKEEWALKQSNECGDNCCDASC